MKKCIFALALVMLLSLSVLASAENDSVTTGPYKVSFDLGVPHGTYTVTISEPKSTESLSGDKSTDYNVEIRNNTGLTNFAFVGIYDHETIQPIPTSSDLENIIRNSFVDTQYAYNTYNVETANRVIDNSNGAIGSADVDVSGFKLKEYQAGYRPKFDPTHLYVIITSLMPWDEGTLQLLKTIHIEKVK